MAKKGITATVAEGLVASTRNINEINKANMAAVITDTKANFDEATAPDPGLVKAKQAKGFGNKVKQIAENIVEGAKENTEKEKARLAEIQSHESYKTRLEEQRENRKKHIKK